MKTQDFNEIDNLPTSSLQKGREFLLNQSITGYNIREKLSSLYRYEVPQEKKPTTLNSDQK